MYLVSLTPKSKFRNSHSVFLKILNVNTKVDALKQSGYTTQGRHGEYNAPVATKIYFGHELRL